MILPPVDVLNSPVRLATFLLIYLFIISVFKHTSLLPFPHLSIHGSPAYSYATSIFCVAFAFPPMCIRLLHNPSSPGVLMSTRDMLLVYFVKDFFLPLSPTIVVHHVLCIYLTAGARKYDVHDVAMAVFSAEIGSLGNNVFYLLRDEGNFVNVLVMTGSNLLTIYYALKVKEKNMRTFLWTVGLALIAMREKTILEGYFGN